MKVNAIMLMFIIFAASSLMAASGVAQTLSEVNVSVSVNNGTLRNAFSQIEQQTDFRFAYRNELISAFRNLKINGRQRSVKETLDELLKGTGISYKQLNNSIILFETPSTATQQAVLQETITGVVRDEKNLPMPGVSVKVKGQNNGVTTDGEGRFSISVADNTVYLLFSYVGYETQEYKAASKQNINISLKPDVGTLDAVVVIGYGTTTKRNNTGAVSSITSKDISSQTISDPIAALQGRVAGLDVTGTSGYPGAAYSVHLRGINSILGGQDPLYIVDGVPFISTPLNQFTGANGNTSPLNSINPADIERIDVLKDADATAIYGSRGANGVILITTKKGKSGKTSVDGKVYSGASFVSHKVNMLNTEQYLALRREAYANDGVTPTLESAPDLLEWDQQLDNNWQDKLMGGTAAMTEAQLSLSGGSEQTNFLFSGTYRTDGTVTPGTQDYKRGAINLNVNHQSVDRKFNINASVKYVSDLNKSFISDLSQYFNLPPNFPVYAPDGSFYWFGNSQNPMALFERGYESSNKNLTGNVLAKYNILEGLNAQLSLGYNRISMNQTQTLPERSFNPNTYTTSSGLYGNNERNNYIVEPQLDYSRKIGKGTLSLLAGATLQSAITEGAATTGIDFASDEQLNNPHAAVTLESRSYNYTDYKYTSVFGRATYNWDEKYILNGTFRRDGSSRFGPGKKFGNFGALGAAWIFSNESFLKDHPSVLSFGKFRASYGTVGNDQIGDYNYYDSWSPTSFPYAGSGTLYPSRFPNQNYQWEVNRKFEVAAELGFFKDRILLNASYYRNKSGNMLVNYVLSSQSGFESYIANLPAELENKGFELELTTSNINTERFKWNTSFNLTIARNKLLKYPGLENSSYARTYFIGQPINVTLGYVSTGVDPENGYATFADQNNDGSIDEENDQIILGTVTPKFYGGMQNSFSYKNWSLDFFLQFVKQEGPLLNYGYQSTPYGFFGNKDVSALERWTTPGQTASIPGATADAGSDAYAAYSQWRLSTANWGDASFIRLKNLSLRYNLGAATKNLKISNLTVFVQGQNLFTITGYKGFDPETKGTALPQLTTYTAGLQFSF
ncbi:TonB-dependent receptor [Pedobacter sp. BAL39]|uniref:TonB-dependent receptor n=1 Tax=Pedobacter sp. BAL39 TaxID=391596 RepID=UPI001E626100|nr:TonB-dependent receptor [Pedobacter sp. BAL39]